MWNPSSTPLPATISESRSRACTAKPNRVGRLLERAKDSGRSDDKIEVIRRRFKTHVESCLPILERLKTEGTIVHTIDSAKSVQQVYDSVLVCGLLL
jgi:adenylate kinase family enzyme